MSLNIEANQYYKTAFELSDYRDYNGVSQIMVFQSNHPRQMSDFRLGF